MVITTRVDIDLKQASRLAMVSAVQNDTNTRRVEVHLYNGGAGWVVPEGVTAAVGYRNYPEDDYDVCVAMQEACAMVTFAKQDGDVVTFTCLDDKPDVDIPTTIRAGA